MSHPRERSPIGHTLLFVGLALASRAAAPGLCVQQTVEEALKSAEIVIEAEVLDATPGEPNGWARLVVRPGRVWKAGKILPKVVLSVESPERPPFVAGKKYLMFIGRRSDGKLAIGKCSPLTREVQLASKEIAELARLTSKKP
jgi:hypothetical protein